MAKPEQIILAIDPGSLMMGYALVAITSKKPQLVEMGVLKLSGYADIYVRLAKIHTRVTQLIAAYKPTTFAIEAPFFGKNVQSMLKLGRAQGVAIAAAMQAGIEVTEYSPRKVKQSVTGNGNADKDQVWKMLKQILALTEDQPAYLDASDALGVAMCHFYETSSPLGKMAKSKNAWADFIAQHPEKIVTK